MATEADLQAELLTYQTALATLVSGDRVTEMIVGSGSTQRRYKYQEISEEFLREKIAQIQNDLLAITNVAPSFRSTSVMRTVHRKLG